MARDRTSDPVNRQPPMVETSPPGDWHWLMTSVGTPALLTPLSARGAAGQPPWSAQEGKAKGGEQWVPPGPWLGVVCWEWLAVPGLLTPPSARGAAGQPPSTAQEGGAKWGEQWMPP